MQAQGPQQPISREYRASLEAQLAQEKTDFLDETRDADTRIFCLSQFVFTNIKLGRVREAEKACRTLISWNVNKLSYRSRLGQIYFILGQYESALHEYTEVVQRALAERDADTYFETADSRAIVQFQLGLFTTMIEDLKNGTTVFSDKHIAWTDLSRGYCRLNQFEQAFECQRKAISVEPKLKKIALQEKERTVEAKKIYEKAHKESKKRLKLFQKQKPKAENSRSQKPFKNYGETQDLFVRTESIGSEVPLLTIGETVTHHDFTLPTQFPVTGGTRPLEPTVYPFDVFFKGELMGEGAVGVIHRGKHKDNDVAIKTAKTPQANIHLRNEGFILTGLEHQFVIKFYGASIQNDSILLVTEECDKGSLSRYVYGADTLNFEWQISLSCKLRWMTQIACGIEYLHSQQVLHRDLKPDNIFLTGKNWDVRIGDFSIGCKMLSPEAAHVEGEEELPIGSNLMPPQAVMQGTLPFLAPEILYAYLNHIPVLPYCPATDMYSFAILLYCMITGQQPYPHCDDVKQDEEKLKSFAQPILHGEKPEFTKQTPDSIARLIQGIWNLNPFQRPTASQTHKALQEISESENKQMSKEDKAKLPVMKK